MKALIGIQNPVSDKQISYINDLTSSVNPIRLKNNPVSLDKTAIKELYERLLK